MSLTPGGEGIWWASVVMGSVYVLTAVVVIVSRLRFERQRRLLDRVEPWLAGQSDPGTGIAAGRDRAMAELASAPASILWAIGADSSVPRAIQQMVAQSLLRRVGTERLCESAARRGASAGVRRVAALRALALTGVADGWRLLALALADSSPEVVGATISLLGELDDRRAAVLLVDALHASRYLRSRIATALESFPSDIPDLLIPLLSSEDGTVRYWGAMLIRRYPGTQGLAPRLEALTTDAEPPVRKAALYAIAELGAASAAAAARRCLSDPVPFVRVYAARALGILRVPDSVDALLPLLADRDWWVRSAAKQALEAFGETVGPAVIPYLSHPDAFARNGAAEVLQNTGTFERLLIPEATGPSDPERVSVLKLLAHAGGLQMWDSVLSRLPPASQARARELLIGVELSG